MSDFTWTTRVHFHEADPAGIAFFANILTFCHTAYEEMLHARGYPLSKALSDRSHAVPLVHAEADYKQPLRFGESISILVHVAERGERKFELAYVIHDANGTEMATARTVHVCVDLATGRSTGLPAPLARALDL